MAEIKVLIIDDDDFPEIKKALDVIPEVKIINAEEHQTITEYNKISEILDQYKDSFDLIIIDLQIGAKSNKGLEALDLWLSKQEPSIEPEEVNFGVIAITRHSKEEVDDALGLYPQRFGNSFLGLVLKDNYPTQNLQRLITNGFLTPPFVQGDEKYFNTALLGTKFSQFGKGLQIKAKEGTKEISETVAFSEIVLVRKKDGKLEIWKNDGVKFNSRSVEIDGQTIDGDTFFNIYCYDPSLKGYGSDPDNDKRREHRITGKNWNQFKESSSSKTNELDTYRKNSKKEIRTQLNNNKRPFIHVGIGIAINLLYLKKSALIKESKKEDKEDIKYINLSRKHMENVFIEFGYKNNVDKLREERKKKAEKEEERMNENNGVILKDKILKEARSDSQLDSEGTIKSYIQLYKTTNSFTNIVPLFGRKGEFSLEKNSNEIRLQDSFSDRVFAFDELCSDRWQSLLKQLAKHYKCY